MIGQIRADEVCIGYSVVTDYETGETKIVEDTGVNTTEDSVTLWFEDGTSKDWQTDAEVDVELSELDY